MYLLDSNICIYVINRKSREIVEHIKKLKPTEVKLSAISLGELEYGVSKSSDRNKNRMALFLFASGFDIIEFNDYDAEAYGIIRADLERKGKIIGPYDMQIAAQAITRDLILVTNNIKEFSRIPNLKYDNWI